MRCGTAATPAGTPTRRSRGGLELAPARGGPDGAVGHACAVRDDRTAWDQAILPHEHAAPDPGSVIDRRAGADAGIIADMSPRTDRDGVLDDTPRSDGDARREMAMAAHQRVVPDGDRRDDEQTRARLIGADQVRILADQAPQADAHVVGLAYGRPRREPGPRGEAGADRTRAQSRTHRLAEPDRRVCAPDLLLSADAYVM